MTEAPTIPTWWQTIADWGRLTWQDLRKHLSATILLPVVVGLTVAAFLKDLNGLFVGAATLATQIVTYAWHGGRAALLNRKLLKQQVAEYPALQARAKLEKAEAIGAQRQKARVKALEGVVQCNRLLNSCLPDVRRELERTLLRWQQQNSFRMMLSGELTRLSHLGFDKLPRWEDAPLTPRGDEPDLTDFRMHPEFPSDEERAEEKERRLNLYRQTMNWADQLEEGLLALRARFQADADRWPGA